MFKGGPKQATCYTWREDESYLKKDFDPSKCTPSNLLCLLTHYEIDHGQNLTHSHLIELFDKQIRPQLPALRRHQAVTNTFAPTRVNLTEGYTPISVAARSLTLTTVVLVKHELVPALPELEELVITIADIAKTYQGPVVDLDHLKKLKKLDVESQNTSGQLLIAEQIVAGTSEALQDIGLWNWQMDASSSRVLDRNSKSLVHIRFYDCRGHLNLQSDFPNLQKLEIWGDLEIDHSVSDKVEILRQG